MNFAGPVTILARLSRRYGRSFFIGKGTVKFPGGGIDLPK